MATPTITNPNSLGDTSDLTFELGGLDANFKTSAAVTDRRVVSIGTTGQVAVTATNGTLSLCVGVAIAAAASGDIVPVRMHGVVENVPATGAVSAGDLLKASATTAGSVTATATPTAGQVVAVAINDSASSVVDVFVCPSKGLS